MMWFLIGAVGIAAIYFFLPKSRNEKSLAVQRQMLRDAEEVYADLIKQLDHLPALKARHEDDWPPSLNINGTRAQIVEAGNELPSYRQRLERAVLPLDRESELELQGLALSFVQASTQIGDLIAPLVVTETMREAVSASGGFGRKGVS